MASGYNKQLSISDSNRSDLIAKSFGIETEGIGTALTLGRTARKLGIDTQNKSQLDVFKELEQEYKSEQNRKNTQNLITNLSPAPIETASFKRTDIIDKTPAKNDLSATASSSYQFFVWKDGTAGRMTVPVDFGFKEL